MQAYLYVLNTLADYEIAYLTSELNSGRFLDKTKGTVEIIMVGSSMETVRTMGGLAITPSLAVDNIAFAEGDLLVLPGANTWFESNNQSILNIIPELLQRNITVAAICGATVALAKNGILNNRNHTSNDKAFLKQMCPEYCGDAYYLEQTVIVDGNLITASGLAALEFSCEIFKKTEVMKPDILEAWYQLYNTKESKYFYRLMEL